MSEAAGFGAALPWLPDSVRRAQELEARREDQQAAQEQRDRADRAEQARDRAVAAYLTEAATRGEPVSPADMAAGRIGFTASEAIARHQELADRVPKHQRPERDYELLDPAGEPVLHSASRADDGWPGSAYLADRLIRQAEDLHRDRVAYLARTRYPDAVEAARAKSTAQVTRPGRDSHRDTGHGEAYDHHCRRCGALSDWCRCR